MIARTRKTSVLRSVLIVALIMIVFAGMGYLYLNYKKAPLLLSDNIETTVSVPENSALIDTCIYRLYDADNNSRLYAITGENNYLKRSYADMIQVLNTIDKIKFSWRGTADPVRFKKLVQEKINKNYDYIRLRLLTDEMIKNSGKVSRSLRRVQVRPEMVAHHIKTVKNVKITPPHVQRKKKFFDRVIASLSELKEARNPKTAVVTKDTVIYSQKLSTVTTHSGRKAYNYYKKLNAANKQLIMEEQNILELNNEIIASLKAYKAIEQVSTAANTAQPTENLSYMYSGFNKRSVFNFVLLAFVSIVVLYNIWQMFRNKRESARHDNNNDQYDQLKSKFLADMGQEIQTPLNSMIGVSEQLSRESLQPHQQEQVAALRNSSEKILGMVNEILNLSKYENDKMTFESAPFMLNQAIAEVCETMTIQATQKGIRLENLSNINDNLCCEGDQTRLKQVLTNLISNAIKFTPRGKVVIQANTTPAVAGNFKLRVRVLDTGIGIDKADLPYVFDEFAQVAGAQKAMQQKGAGLGLAACKKIIELQGGGISVTSTPGEGSIFSFELPFKQLIQRTRHADPKLSYSSPQR